MYSFRRKNNRIKRKKNTINRKKSIKKTKYRTIILKELHMKKK